MGTRMGIAAAVVASLVTWIGLGSPDAAHGRDPAATQPAAARPDRCERPSHHGRYTAVVIGCARDATTGRPYALTLRFETADGRPVERASVRARAWMPDTGRAAPRPPRVQRGRDATHSVVVLLDAPGWWSIALTVTGPVGTDSLSFNLTPAGLAEARRAK